MKKTNGFTRIITLLLALALLFTLAACGRDEEPQPSADSVQPSAAVEPENSSEPVPASTELQETADAGEDYIAKLTFIGDSTTYGLKYYGVLPGGENTDKVWTPASGTLALFNQSIATIAYPGEEEELLITDAVERAKPEYLVLTIGVNGVSMMDETAFKEDYIDLVERIQSVSPETKIICNSIYPVETSYEAKDNGINNAVIDTANGWIYQIAEQTGTRFCNSASALKLSDGSLDPAYGNGDGIHLCADGFNAVLNYLRTHAYI